MIQSEGEEEIKFNLHLNEYWNSRGVSLAASIPIFDKEPINMFKLYKAVCKRGGGRSVSNKENWKSIADEFSLAMPDAAAFFKRTYQRLLFPYEQKYYFGKEMDVENLDVIPEKKRRLMKIEEPPKQPAVKVSSTIQTKSSTYAAQRDQQQQLEELQSSSALLQELYKQYEKEEKCKNIYYLKRDKLSPAASEIKRITYGLESKIRTEVFFALNMLLLYSSNSISNQLIFDEFPNIAEAMNTYMVTINPPKSNEHMEQLRTITVILRNFTLNTSYLQMLLKSTLFSTLIKMYNSALDRQCSRNIVDIMTGLVKVGWDCNEIIRQIREGLENENTEDIEMGVDMIRGLIEEQDENVGGIVVANLETFVKLYAVAVPEVRETLLEIFAFVSEINTNSRLALARHPVLIERLVDTLTQGMQQYDKVCQLSALILSNVAVAPGSREHIKMYETELVIIASSDERIGNIAAGILAEINN